MLRLGAAKLKTLPTLSRTLENLLELKAGTGTNFFKDVKMS
jgi:hypothetical protein